MVDGEDYSVKGRWQENLTKFGYDFWYQPRHNVMISSEWGEPNAFCQGFNPGHVQEGMAFEECDFIEFVQPVLGFFVRLEQHRIKIQLNKLLALLCSSHSKW